MKSFYFIFLPVVLVFLYSIPGVFCLSGGGGDWYSYIVYPYYTVYPLLSAWGNLFKCHEEVLFYFFTCCIGVPI